MADQWSQDSPVSSPFSSIGIPHLFLIYFFFVWVPEILTRVLSLAGKAHFSSISPVLGLLMFKVKRSLWFWGVHIVYFTPLNAEAKRTAIYLFPSGCIWLAPGSLLFFGGSMLPSWMVLVSCWLTTMLRWQYASLPDASGYLPTYLCALMAVSYFCCTKLFHYKAYFWWVCSQGYFLF